MNEEDFQIKRIAIGVIAFLLCALVAWLICMWISRFYNSSYPFLAGLIFIIQTIILYLLFKKTNIMSTFNQWLSRGVGNPAIGDPSPKPVKKYTEEYITELKEKLQQEKQEEIDKIKKAHLENIEKNYISRESHVEALEKLKDDIKKNYVPLTEYEKIFREKRLLDTLVNRTRGLLDDCTLSKDKELLNALLEKLQVYFDLVHYEKEMEEYFEEELIRPRKESDPQNVDKIETCPALFLKSECIIKGKYIKIIDESK